MTKSSNGETPFSLTYGTKAMILVEIGMPTLRTTEVDMIKNDEALEINFDLMPTTKGVGLRVENSHTGNHPIDDFMPLETIRRLLVVIGKRSHSGFEGEAFEPERRDVNVILPKKSQTILDAPLGYVELLLDENKLDKKSFKDKVPLHPEMDPLYDQIATYPCIVRTFPDLILYLAGLKTTWKHSPKRPVIYNRRQEMDFRSFMLEGVDGELNFLPAEGVSEGRNSPSSKSVNNDAPVIGATPLSSVYPSNIVKNVTDSDDPSYGEDEQTLVGPSLPPHPEVNKKLKILGKRKVASGIPGKALPSKVQKVLARASKVVGEASTPLDVNSDSDIHEFPSAKELRDATDYQWVVAHVTPPSWKQHLREISIEQLCDIHDRAYMRRLFLIMAYAELERKCNEALQDLDKNPLVFDMRAEIKVLQGQVDGLHIEYSRLILEEKNSLKQDRAAIVSKVIPDAAMKLVRINDLGVLIAKLVRSSIIYGQYQAFEEVAAMKKPFVLEKMLGYRPSLKEEYDQAGDALANASYPFLAEYFVNPYASLGQQLSKKPPSLRPILSGPRFEPLS
ncbi:hypothetical protein Tco_1296028 [Tanacetum coccineum]